MNMSADRRARVVEFLQSRGADEIHLHHRTLLTHLTGTEELLHRWNAPEPLVTAGLVHAAYGTDGLASPLVPVGDRQILRDLVGETAEKIVYVYGCCDRRSVYPQLAGAESVRWRDRFTDEEWTVDGEDLRQFMELTWANALEAAAAQTDADWDSIRLLFAMTSHLVSNSALDTATATLGPMTPIPPTGR